MKRLTNTAAGSGDAYYNEEFYNSQMEGSAKSAEVVLPAILEILPRVNSVVDFGCGAGTWLSVLKKLGVSEIRGYDGIWAEKKLLIPRENFTAVELDKEAIRIERKYDLAISLEVAEHLPESSARNFIKTLTDSSDIVLFSAAIPSQGGTNHINERWQSYWRDIFDTYGFAGTDFPRRKFWNMPDVDICYRQNMVLYVKKEQIETIAVPKEYFSGDGQMDCVHPELYIMVLNRQLSLPRLYKTALTCTLKKLFGRK
jgi:SAM-dependent methyltransferase